MAVSREIGPFEVLEKLGAGGMGEVFKARDTRLNRFVALKFLPEAASDAARERFQREAMAIAALNHPNICILHEAGEHQGQPYLVMELLEGETLYARLARGPVPVPQLMQWGAEIADALQAAHAKGILHRDLKPGNVFVTQRGNVKVLDFGLAQFAPAHASSAEAATFAGSAAPIPGLPPLTTPGATLGTAAYMSPEQARGEPLDPRSDLFSLGVVLYQTASGQPPFQGRTSADLSAAILMRTPPPPSSLRAEIPPRLDDIIAQCLEKDPDLRFQSASELRVSLKRLAGASSSGVPSSNPGSHPVAAPTTGASAVALPPSAPPSASGALPGASRRARWISAASLAVIAIAGLAWWLWRARAGAGSEAAANLNFRQLTYSGQVQDAAISPDGKFLAHVDAGPQGTSLHLLSVANGSDVQIMPPSPGCCASPSFSPDGSSVYFVDDKTLKTIPVLGGAVRTIAGNACSGAAISPDGKRLAYLVANPGSDQLMLAGVDGTQPHLLSDPRPGGYNSACWLGGPSEPDAPAWSPDGRWVAVDRSEPGANISDHIVLINSLDGRTRVLGPDLGLASSDFAWLADGSGIVLTISKPSTTPSQVWEITYPGGELIQLTHDLQGFHRVTVASQAGGALALVHSSPAYSVWRQARPGAAFEQLPGGGADRDGFHGLAWTPAGQIVSVRSLAGQSQLWLENDTAPARQIPVSNLPAAVTALQVTPDGHLVFAGVNPGNPWNIYCVDLRDNSLTDLTPGINALNPTLTESGRTAAFLRIYTANNTNRQRLWTVPLAGGSPREVGPSEIYTNFMLGLPDQEHVLALAVAGGGPVQFSLLGGAPVAAKAREYRGRFDKPYAISPDGKALVGVITAGNTANLWAAPLDGGPLYQITHFTDQDIHAYAWSRDGRLALSRGSQNSDAVLATALAPTARR